MARTCRFVEDCTRQGCNTKGDFTSQMVLDTVVRGIQDIEVTRKMFAKPEAECTLDEVEKFVSAEEVGQESLH